VSHTVQPGTTEISPATPERRWCAGLAVLFCACGSGALAPDFVRLEADVTVVRDTAGIPHVFGKNARDVAYAAGYEQARDRLFQMDLLRRTAQGRMAEVLGAEHNGTKLYDQDYLLRAVGFYRSAVETNDWLRRNDAETYTMLSAYAAGVSAFIADARAGRMGSSLPYGFRATELGYEPEPWRPADSIAIGKLQTWALSSSVSYELLSTLIQYVLDPDTMADLVTYKPPESTFVLPGFPAPGGAFGGAAQATRAPRRDEETHGPRLSADELVPVVERLANAVRAMSPLGLSAGSNNWVVSGAHTASGKPILCNDPHLPLVSPTNLYLMHLNTADQGGDLDVAGVAFPGAPVIVIGHNRRIAWGATVARGDVADVFAERMSPDRKRTQHTSGEEVIREHEETIRVRRSGGGSPAFEERKVLLQEVPRHGPVLPADVTLPPALANADLLSFAWTGLGVTNEIGGFTRLNRARRVGEFVRAMNEITVGAQNFVYADADGNIAHYAHARYPIRKKLDRAKPPWFAVPGSGEYDWTKDAVPNDRIPQALNPASGYIATANNDPVGVTATGDPLSGPFYLGPLYDPGYRAYRITTELERLIARARTGAKIDADDMKTLQTDVYSRIADRLVPHLGRAVDLARAGTPSLERYASNAALNAAADRLVAWDRRALRSSGEAALFHLWLGYFGAGTLRDEIGATIFDRAVEANLDVMLRPLVFLADSPATASGHDYFDDVRTAETETREHAALRALERALEHGARLYGSSDVSAWRWDTIHTVTFTNTYGGGLDIGPVGIQGGVGTVDVAEPALASKEGTGTPPDVLKTVHGANLRMVVAFDAAGNPEAHVILPGGQSGVPGTPHFGDQVDSWANGRYIRMAFTRADVERAAESTVIFRAGAAGP
jgi:penicillin amidase